MPSADQKHSAPTTEEGAKKRARVDEDSSIETTAAATGTQHGNCIDMIHQLQGQLAAALQQRDQFSVQLAQERDKLSKATKDLEETRSVCKDQKEKIASHEKMAEILEEVHRSGFLQRIGKQYTYHKFINSRIIFLSHSGIQASDALQISLALQDPLCTVTTLELCDNFILDKGASRIAKGLCTNTTLVKLKLGRNLIENSGTQALANALRLNGTLSELDLSANKIGDLGAQDLAAALQLNKSLRVLCLDRNNITNKGAEALAACLKVTSCSLTHLGLEFNDLGDPGAQCIAEALRFNSKLQELGLGECYITDNGADALAKAMVKNSSLTTLILEGNEVGSRGVGSLANALRFNNTLIKLDLSGNGLGDSDVHELAAALRSNKTLEIVNMFGNHITNNGANLLAQVLRFNTGLKTLDFSYNRIGEVGIKALHDTRQYPVTRVAEYLVRTGSAPNQLDLLKLADLVKYNTTLVDLELHKNNDGASET